MKRGTAPWLLLALLLSACSALKYAMPHDGSDLSELTLREEAQAGVAQIDITPPPGLGLFGHGPESRIAEGTLLRLRCHAFVLVGARLQAAQDPEALAFVPCELAAPSLLLQRLVASKVRAQGVPLGADRIWIAATHTHAAPGHYFASDSFSGPTSGRRIGFDRAVLEFLAERIARVVCAAYRDLKPARWAWAKSDALGLGRNRAYPAFVKNRSFPHVLAQQLAQPHEDVTQAAVDGQLSLLRIDQRVGEGGAFEPSAALLVFGLHPTVIDHQNALYGGDVFGYAQRALATTLREQLGRRVLVALANGIEGDVTAVRTDSTATEARRIGGELAARAWNLWKRWQGADPVELDAKAELQSAYRDLDLKRARVWRAGALCEVPELGTPAGGGADDHPTFLRAFEPFNPGVRATQPRPCHGPKYPIKNLGEAFAGKSFPRVAPVSAARIGNGLLIALPAELTTVTGMRIRESAQALMPPRQGVTQVTTVVGLTNEYIEYVATADEYDAQRYEGASTLYGPQSAEFLREQAECLAKYLLSDGPSACNGQVAQINRPTVVRYTPSFEIDWWGRLPARTKEMTASLSTPESVLDEAQQPTLSALLRGVYPMDVKDPDGFSVQVWAGEQLLDDTEGARFVLQWDDVARHWRVSWTPDRASSAVLCGQALHFRARARGRSFASTTSVLSCATQVVRAQP